MTSKRKFAGTNLLNDHKSKPTAFDEKGNDEAKMELKDLGEKIQKDIRSEIKSIGRNIQQAIVTEIRALVHQFPPEVSNRRTSYKESLLSPQPKMHQIGNCDVSSKQDLSRGVPVKEHSGFGQSEYLGPVKHEVRSSMSLKDQSFAPSDFTTPLKAQFSKQGSNFSPAAAGGSSVFAASPWENRFSGRVGELDMRQSRFTKHKHRKEPIKMQAEILESSDGDVSVLKHMMLPDKPPPMLDLNVPPQPPEVDLEAGEGEMAFVGETHSTRLGITPCSQACGQPRNSRFEFVENLSEATEVSDCISDQDPSLCDIVDAPRESLIEALPLGDKVANRLSISRELARHKPKNGDGSKAVWSMSVRELLSSPKFDNLVGLIIMINAVSIGIQTEIAARSVEAPDAFEMMETAFAVWFTTELSLRIYVYRLSFFVPFREGWVWNWFDFTVVVAQLLEILVDQLAKSSSVDVGKFRLLRVLRILRLVRILRVVRVLHLISELRTIVSSIIGSLQSLGWTCVLLFLMIYIVAVYFTQSITDHIKERRANGIPFTEGEEKLVVYFASLLRGILSLFQAMSGGLDWNEMAGPLFVDVGMIQGLCFSAYIAFALLALMNVVTGVFVQTALQSARNEEDAFMTDQIVSLFSMSEKKEQTIGLEEIEESLSNSATAKEWGSIGVGEADARYLFRLLDVDGTGKVPFEEFLGGALRLNGGAKAIDLLTVMQESRKSNDTLFQRLDTMQEVLSAVTGSVERLEHTSSNGLAGAGASQSARDDGLCCGIEFLVEAARHNQQEIKRITDIEGSLQHIQESLHKLQTVESLLSNIPFQISGNDDQSSVV